MCYNENISLNTFIFSIAVMGFIYYNNKYTQYKTEIFQNKFVYLFFISIVLMQLIEYFLWKSIKTSNAKMNYIASIIGWITLRILQPLSFIFLFPSAYTTLKNPLIILYLILLAVLTWFRKTPIDFKTTVKNGHLYWNWFNGEKTEYIFLLIIYFAFSIPAFSMFSSWLKFIILIYLIYLYLNNYENWSSMWCWSINLTFIYYLFYILIIFPYREYNGLC
jgi:hypothetical protein